MIEDISRTEVKLKARNSGDSSSSVTGNGGAEHWSGDRSEAMLDGVRRVRHKLIDLTKTPAYAKGPLLHLTLKYIKNKNKKTLA